MLFTIGDHALPVIPHLLVDLLAVNSGEGSQGRNLHLYPDAISSAAFLLQWFLESPVLPKAATENDFWLHCISVTWDSVPLWSELGYTVTWQCMHGPWQWQPHRGRGQPPTSPPPAACRVRMSMCPSITLGRFDCEYTESVFGEGQAFASIVVQAGR